MMGIYKFQNKINGKVYIGQSIQLEQRYKSHLNNHNNENLKDYQTKFYRALRKYGFDNFSYEILELSENFTKEELNEKEEYWISYYDSFKNGYNSNNGGDRVTNCAEEHPMAELTNSQVLEIKEKLKNTEITQYDLAKEYNISQSIISQINDGFRWTSVGADIYTYPIRYQGIMRAGEKNPKAVLTNEDVIEMRKRYVNETANEIYKDYKDKCSMVTLNRVLRGATYKELPIYRKREKRWINIDS